MQFDYFLVCAFEFTSDKKPQEPQEIIEFCVFKYCLKSQTATERFHTYVKPQHPVNQKLSTFCKMLTCISDSKLRNAPSLNDVLVDFDRWMWKQGLHQARFIFVPHSHFDLSHMLPDLCTTLDYHCPAYFFTWLHLEELHTTFLSEQVTVTDKPSLKQIRRKNSQSLLRSFDIVQQGRLHSAADNCTNTVNLIRSMTERGVDFTAKVWHTNLSKRDDDSDTASLDDDDDSEDILKELLFSGRSTPTSGRLTPVRPGNIRAKVNWDKLVDCAHREMVSTRPYRRSSTVV